MLIRSLDGSFRRPVERAVSRARTGLKRSRSQPSPAIADAKVSTNATAGDVIAEHVRLVGAELPQHGPSDGVTGDNRVVQVELLEHGGEVGGGLMRSHPIAADGRLAVSSQVIGEDPEPV